MEDSLSTAHQLGTGQPSRGRTGMGVGLWVGIGMAGLLIVALGAGWFTSYRALSTSHRQLQAQTLETAKYANLADDYAARLEDESARLDKAQDSLIEVQSDLYDVRTKYQESTSQLAQVSSQLSVVSGDLRSVEAELKLHKETWGSVVASGIRPPFQNVRLVESSTAVDPTWTEVQAFILQDRTDEIRYDLDSYVCGEFASDVHNNAEAAGLRCALVAIEFEDTWHACNAFKTADRGLVFIDCTGVSGDGPPNRDKTVDLKLGAEYIGTSMFPNPGWESTWQSMGTVLDVHVYW